MKQPECILETGTRVITNNLRSYPLSGVRRKNAPGKINGVVGGMGGDVYCVEHDDGTRGSYCFDEFELETNEANSTSGPVVVKGLTVPGGGETTMAIGWTNTTSPESVVEILCTTQYGVVDGVGCAALDLDGITKLRAALDRAEAAWMERQGVEGCS